MYGVVGSATLNRHDTFFNNLPLRLSVSRGSCGRRLVNEMSSCASLCHFGEKVSRCGSVTPLPLTSDEAFQLFGESLAASFAPGFPVDRCSTTLRFSSQSGPL